MIRLSRSGLILVALVCGLGWYSGAQAAANCRTPEPQTLISWYHKHYPNTPLHYSSKNSLIYHPIEVFQTQRPRRNWIGLAWLAPEWGALFAADCNGNPVAGMSVGAIGKIQAGPALPKLGQTVMFIYVRRETADCVHDEAQIVALKDNKIIALWNHAYRQGMNRRRAGKPHSFVTRNHLIVFGENGQLIRVTGQVAEYLYLKNGSQSPTPAATHALPEENYRWDPARLSFVPERHYSESVPCRLDARAEGSSPAAVELKR